MSDTFRQEMRASLERRGYDPEHADRLLAEGMGPEELRGRLAMGPREEDVGGLGFTHRIFPDALPPVVARSIARHGVIALGDEPLTVTLHGFAVLAKLYKGRPSAYTFANRSQANAKAAKLGSGWEVVQWGRPWFVRRVK